MRRGGLGRLGVAGVVGQAAWTARRHWRAVPAERRARLQALLRQTGGQPSNLSAAERQELKELLAELDVGGALRSVATSRGVRGGRGFGRRF